MKKIVPFFACLITCSLLAEYTHTIKIDPKVKNTPGAYEFMIGSPGTCFTLIIASDQKLSVITLRNVEVSLTNEGLTFSIAQCLEKILLRVNDGQLKGQTITARPKPGRRSTYGTSLCAPYTFRLSMDTQNQLSLQEQ